MIDIRTELRAKRDQPSDLEVVLVKKVIVELDPEDAISLSGHLRDHCTANGDEEGWVAAVAEHLADKGALCLAQ